MQLSTVYGHAHSMSIHVVVVSVALCSMSEGLGQRSFCEHVNMVDALCTWLMGEWSEGGLNE